MKPDDIPQDIWDASMAAFGASEDPYCDIARAIMAERERCAQKAENFRHDNPYPTVYGAIAAVIRSGA